ncbi:MAG TPA: phospholipid carrier-dependent glycosyltransferase [Chloroflexia bacterium]|nr:phospholipid carrier-dependent glycosyltransferase [Chloroflexia bacterium]
MLAGRERTTEGKNIDNQDNRGYRWQLVISRIGLGLLALLTLAWFITFPTLHFISIGFSGDRSPATLNQAAPGPAEFFRTYPQLLWLGFVLGAALFFGFRPGSFSGASTPSSKNTEITLAGKVISLPGWANLIWRIGGIALLGLALYVAAAWRIGDARNIGATDLIRTDYDEGVHSSAALLMAQGHTIYRDFFLTQPPVGPFLWSLPLRFGGDQWGGLSDFLRLRLFTSLISLLTIALVYLTGRRLGGRWAGPVAGAIAALALAIDGGAVRTEQQVMLEPLLNVFTAAALCAFVHYARIKTGRRLAGLVPLLLAGLFAGIAVSVKIPGLAVVLGLGLALLCWRQWKAAGFYALAVLAGYFLASGYFLLTSGTTFIKQAYLYQLLRPFNNLALTGNFQAETTLTAFDYIWRTPYLAFTLLAAVFGLMAIVLRWLTGKGAENWLPVALVAVITCLLYTGKAGFFPHYYDHMVLPLALLAGGMVNFWLPQWWKGRFAPSLALVATLALAFILWPHLQHVGDQPSKPEWSEERALDHNFDLLGVDTETLFTWDARYSFITGTPMTTDAYNKYVVDSAAYVEYLALGLEKQQTIAAIGEVLGKKAGDDMRQLRYMPVVQDDLLKASEKADYVLLEARSDSQLTPQTTQEIKRDLINRLDSKDLDIYSNVKDLANQSGALFGDKITLVGFENAPQVNLAQTGNKIPLRLYWRGEQKIPDNYVVFVHLLNEAGDTVAQRDNAPRNGQWDTSKWVPGETFDDDMSLNVATKLPPGRYKLEIGVYQPADGKRLPVSNAPASEVLTSGGDSIIIQEVEILGL